MRNKEFSYIFLSITLAAVLVFPLFASEEVAVNSVWIEEPVKVDGSESDWQSVKLFLQEKAEVEFAFKNDSRNLYIIFIFDNPKKMSSIDRTGMTLWFDTQGTKKKTYGIRFQRKMIPTPTYIALLEKQMGPLPPQMKAQLQQKKAHLVYHNQVIDKKNEQAIMTTGPTAPQFKTKRGKEIAVYEFRIPLGKKEGHVVGIGTEPGKRVNVGFEWGGITKEMKDEMMKRRAAMSRVSDRAASIHGDLKTEREGVRGSYEMPVRFPKGTKKYAFWVDVTLASRK
ncbi:MAG: hypothetical protein ACE5LC_08910 [Candidatus Aminicenantales bacterium]